ncbi:hypothetical protein [Roseicella sp. DB1501]|uniref:hypothetical protein n=1 Tax=Roseicella sp. DB1501 TaxID=2730925 RepID=UPI0014923018|nr:hypothetical protein [Roseicella sp. DB1501]NOG72752.1 hypothetical protein [Roseicella sp. DB1501]
MVQQGTRTALGLTVSRIGHYARPPAGMLARARDVAGILIACRGERRRADNLALPGWIHPPGADALCLSFGCFFVAKLLDARRPWWSNR